MADTVQEADLWVMDRNFCVLGWVCRIHQQSAFFVVRQHGNTPYKPLKPLELIGKSTTGDRYEQPVEMTAPSGEKIQARRVVVKLKKPTRNGDTFVVLSTNLPREIDTLIIAELYRNRWKIETAFQKLESHLNSELNTSSRRAKLGISCRVQVPAGQGLATHPYRVLGRRRSRRKVASKAGQA